MTTVHRTGTCSAMKINYNGKAVPLWTAGAGDTLVAVAEDTRFYDKGDQLVLAGWFMDRLGEMHLRFQGRRGSFHPRNFRPLKDMPTGFIPNQLTSLNSAML